MLAQTNLQLYRQLMAEGWSLEQLIQMRSAYDLAAQLFAACMRPSHKPFLCHLVGTASALAAWQQRPELVIAGLLHSAYLYGDFGEGQRGVTDAKRAYLGSIVGDEAEQLIYRYSVGKGSTLLEITDRDQLVMELADLLDELSDAGPVFAPCKRVIGINHESLDEEATRQQVVALAEQTVGPEAGQAIRVAYADCLAATIPATLATDNRAYQTVQPGVAEFRKSYLARKLIRIKSKLRRYQPARNQPASNQRVA